MKLPKNTDALVEHAKSFGHPFAVFQCTVCGASCVLYNHERFTDETITCQQCMQPRIHALMQRYEVQV